MNHERLKNTDLDCCVLVKIKKIIKLFAQTRVVKLKFGFWCVTKARFSFFSDSFLPWRTVWVFHRLFHITFYEVIIN